MFRSFRAAFSFLTILPLGPRKISSTDLGGAVRWFPVVGAVHGLFLGAVFSGLGMVFPQVIAAWLAVFVAAGFNAMLHWDGLADSADGLGGTNPEKRRAIMKDSRLGAFGGIALLFLVSGKILALANLAPERMFLLVIVGLLSRWSMALQIYTQPIVSQGLLRGFQIDHPWRDALFATLLMLAAVIGSGVTAVCLALAAVVFLIVMNKTIRHLFGGLTGDLLGASCELLELLLLVVLNSSLPMVL
jgi:adenosylcobinamide-GDP ribazoletransferase